MLCSIGFNSGWPQLTLQDLRPHQCITLWSVVPSTKFGGHRAFLRNLISGWPRLMPAWSLTPAKELHFDQGFFLPNLVVHWSHNISKQFDLWLTLADPCMTFDPQQCIMLRSGVLPTKFGGHRALLSKLTPTWPLHDLWPQQCITLWSGTLATKFGGHRAFLSNLTPGWPWMTPAWPLTPAMHYALVRCSSHQIWWS